MLKCLCRGNFPDDNKSQALASCSEDEGSLAEGLCSQGSKECSSAATQLPTRCTAPLILMQQLCTDSPAPEDHFQLHPESDPTQTSETAEHQVIQISNF